VRGRREHVVVARRARCEIPRLQEEKHDVLTQSYPVVRGRKSNNNRIRNGRSNYMDSRHHTSSSAPCMAHMLFEHAFSGHGSLTGRSKAGDLCHRRAANLVRLNHPFHTVRAGGIRLEGRRHCMTSVGVHSKTNTTPRTGEPCVPRITQE
jgi:hypothetical protein